MKHLLFTVTNDLSYDQRMQRICSSLSKAGYKVTLVGRRLSSSIQLQQQLYQQKRLTCWFAKGKLMYLEFNFRLLVFLFFKRANAICAIDLDTILPVYLITSLKRVKRIYDAHELFAEQKEIVTRPAIQKLWLKVERFTVPKFKNGYTVNKFIADELKRRYGVEYAVIKNMPQLKAVAVAGVEVKPFIIYQGAVNEGRSFETLIPAMKNVNADLVICGNGNFFEQVKKLIKKNKVADKVMLRDYVPPEELAELTPKARVAITLFENTGLNQFHSLANRFFDYVMAGVPQVCVGYPEYEAINDRYGVAYLIYNTSDDTIATALNHLLNDNVLYESIKANCMKAREVLNWESEEKVLIEFYDELV